MKPTSALAAFASLGALSLAVASTPAPSEAQDTTIAGMRTLDLPLLLDLPGDLAYVRYTPGSLDRSVSIQTRFELLTLEFERSGFKRNALVIYVLSRDDWHSAKLKRPYGLPEPLGLDAIAVPGWADEAVVKTYRDALGGELPLPLGKPIFATPEEAAALAVADILTQLEVARMLVQRTELPTDRGWIEPLMAHLVARLAWDHYEPGRMTQIAGVVDRLAASGTSGARRRLDEWNLELPPAARWWFDARFMRGADEMVLASTPRKLWKLLEKGISGKEPITEALLLSKFPKLLEWRVANFAP